MTQHTAPQPGPLLARRELLDVDRLERAAMQNAEAAPPSPVPAAIGYTIDRLDRLDHVLEELASAIVRLGSKVEPILTDGSYRTDPQLGGQLADPVAEDTRSQVAQRITGLAVRTDQAADVADQLRRRVEAITTAVEV